MSFDTLFWNVIKEKKRGDSVDPSSLAGEGSNNNVRQKLRTKYPKYDHILAYCQRGMTLKFI
jgi:lambda repressor-like predicted transcriptional regulator